MPLIVVFKTWIHIRKTLTLMSRRKQVVEKSCQFGARLPGKNRASPALLATRSGVSLLRLSNAPDIDFRVLLRFWNMGFHHEKTLMVEM